MASKALTSSPSMIGRAAWSPLPVTSRALSTVSQTAFRNSSLRTIARPSRLNKSALQQNFRRTYADAPAANLSPEPRPKRRFRFFRWTWRLTYLSAIGGTGYFTYQIWQLRHPDDQFEPDPSKKTLVILGTGWGSVSLLKKLDTENYNVIVGKFAQLNTHHSLI